MRRGKTRAFGRSRAVPSRSMTDWSTSGRMPFQRRLVHADRGGSGLLSAPIDRALMRIGTGERLDAVVNFAGRLGQDIYLHDQRSGTNLVKFRVNQDLTDTSSVPGTLRPVPVIGEPTITRTFNFDRTGGRWTINGERFSADRTDALPVLGQTEKWILHNATGAAHPVHSHGVDQLCMSRNGGPCLPNETMKETWFLDPGETVEVKLRFTDFTWKYVLHCHILHTVIPMEPPWVLVPDSHADSRIG